MTREERSWIWNDVGNSAYSVAITTAILPIFFKDAAAKDLPASVSTAYLGYANTASALVMALLAPLLGALADYRGYKKPLFLFFTVLGCLSTALLFLVDPGEYRLCLWLYGISAAGFAGMAIFYDSFLIDITKRENYDRLSSQGYGYGYIGSVIPFLLALAFILKPEFFGFPSTLRATQASFVLIALWWILFSLPLLRHVRQVHGLPPEKGALLSSFRRLGETLSQVRAYKKPFLFLLAYFFYIDGVSTAIKMATAFGMDIGISTSSLLIIVLYIQVVAFPFALLFGRLAGRFGNRNMLLAGIGIYIVITFLAYFTRTEWQFWVLATLVASSQGGMQALSRSAFAELIPEEKSAEFFGFYNISGKFAAILGPGLVGVLAHLTGDTRQAMLGLLLFFGLGGALLIKASRTA